MESMVILSQLYQNFSFFSWIIIIIKWFYHFVYYVLKQLISSKIHFIWLELICEAYKYILNGHIRLKFNFYEYYENVVNN